VQEYIATLGTIFLLKSYKSCGKIRGGENGREQKSEKSER
jgi:hypothetical protein